MNIEQLRKLWREMEEKRLLVKNYTAPELPNIWDPYEPMNQGATSLGATSSGTIPPGLTSSEPTVTPEIVEPSVPEPSVPEPPEMQQIYVPEEDVLNIAAIPAANTASGSANNQAQTASALGEAGSKALAGFLVNVSDYYKEQRRQNLTDAYNAGLNGVDLSRKTKDDAAAGLYIDQLWAMYDAGKQDAKAAAERENEETMSNNVETAQHETVDNWGNISYPNNATSGNDVVGSVKYFQDAANHYGSPKQHTSNNSATKTDFQTDHNFIRNEPGKNEDDLNWDRDYDYMKDMMFLNGAVNSADPSIQLAYQYMMNQENRGKQIPTEVMEAYEKFMNGLKDGSIGYQKTTQDMRNAQRKRSHEIAMGNADIDDYTYDDLKTRNDLFPSTEEDNFQYPTADVSAVTQGYGKWYDPKDGYHMGIDIGESGGKNSNICAI